MKFKDFKLLVNMINALGKSLDDECCLISFSENIYNYIKEYPKSYGIKHERLTGIEKKDFRELSIHSFYRGNYIIGREGVSDDEILVSFTMTDDVLFLRYVISDDSIDLFFN